MKMNLSKETVGKVLGNLIAFCLIMLIWFQIKKWVGYENTVIALLSFLSFHVVSLKKDK